MPYKPDNVVSVCSPIRAGVKTHDGASFAALARLDGNRVIWMGRGSTWATLRGPRISSEHVSGHMGGLGESSCEVEAERVRAGGRDSLNAFDSTC